MNTATVFVMIITFAGQPMYVPGHFDTQVDCDNGAAIVRAGLTKPYVMSPGFSYACVPVKK